MINQKECNGCVCLTCTYKPCEDCFTCDLDWYSPNENCFAYKMIEGVNNIKIDELQDGFEQFNKLMKERPLTIWQKIRCFIIYDIPYWFIINYYRLKDKMVR
jgi:hypothetical protein